MIKSLKIQLIISLLSVACAFGQAPNYYHLGKEFFANTQIYDLNQGNDGRYWIATNQGLFQYDGYDFSLVENDLFQGSSLFNLRKTESGEIYFNDLSNRIYRIKNDSISLFFEIEKNQWHHNLFLETLDDKVYVQSENLYVFENGEKKEYAYDIESDNRRIIFRPIREDHVVCMTHKQYGLFDGEKIQVDGRSDVSEQEIQGVTTWISADEREFGIDQKTMELFEYDVAEGSFSYVKTLNQELSGNALRAYVVHDEIWLIGSRNGIYAYDFDWNPLNNGESFYEDRFISDVYTDREGNAILGTFDEGLIVVPDLRMKALDFENQKILGMSFFKDESVLIGSTAGELLSVNLSSGFVKEIYKAENGEAVDFVYYDIQHDLILFAAPKGLGIGRLSEDKYELYNEFTGAVKSCDCDAQRCVIGMNTGVWQLDPVSFEIERVEGLNERTFDVALDDDVLYASTVNGLFMKEDGQAALRLLNKESKTTSVEVLNGKLYTGCGNGDVLEFEDGQLLRTIKLESPIRSIQAFEHGILVKTIEGLSKLEIEKGKVINLVESNGFDAKNIKRIRCSGDRLLFGEDRNVMWTALNSLSFELEKQDVRLDAFLYDDEISNLNLFPYSSAKYVFNFSVSSLKDRDHLSYEYRLLGLDENWIPLSYIDHEVEFMALPPSSYQFEVRSVNGDVRSDAVIYQFVVDSPFYQKWWFFVLILAAVFVLFFLFYQYRLRQVRKKNMEALEKQKMATNLLEMELRALRSQMNPHFIFNSLNSIQSLVLKEDIDNSYDYLVLFAKLVRNTLNYSDLNFIPIDKELEFLEIYLSLEKLRFKTDFEYNIAFDDLMDFEVPPLIIQPFLENALIHGLLHKEGEKKLDIRFELGDHLVCMIEDNGVGREKAKEFEERSKLSEHKSFAMKAIQQRLDLLNKHLGKDIGGYEVIDLFEENMAMGTRVILHLPIERKY